MKRLNPAKTARLWLRVAQWVLASVGVLALGYWAAIFVSARLFQTREAHDFARELQAEVNHDTTASRSAAVKESDEQPPREGAVIAELGVPRLGLSTMVVEGVGDSDLKLAAGHIPGTALPGKSGNIGIAGHRDTFFRPLRFIRKDDMIALTTLRGTSRFRVVSTKIVGPDDVRVLYPTGRDVLTLVTCYPFDFVGSAPRRFIVRAERSEGS
ncbi:MAG: class D sortase [Candidatus Solibacter sp.]